MNQKTLSPMALNCLYGLSLSILATQATANDESLAEVVVSASKYEQTSLEAPSNVTVVTSEQIQNSSAFRLGDALTASVPGLYIRGGALGTTSRDSASSILSLRGAYGSRTKVLLDGVSSLGDANSGGVNFSAIGLRDIERVEISPGVSSSLYGSDAIGGVINIITKAPTKREVYGAYTQGFGDGERKKYEAYYRDRLNSDLAFSIGFDQQEMAGYAGSDLILVTPATCGPSNCTKTVSGWEKTKSTTGSTQYIVGDKGPVASISKNFSSSLYYNLSTTDLLKAGFAHYETSISGSSPPNFYLTSTSGALALPASNLRVDGNRIASLYESAGLLVSTERNENRYFLGYDGKIGNEIQLKLDWVVTDRDYYYLTPTSNSTTTYNGGPGTLTNLPNQTRDYQAQLNFPMGKENYVVLGVSVSESELHRSGYKLTNWRNQDSKSALTDRADAQTAMKSIFLQDQILLSGQTTAYIGGRYDNWTTSGQIYNSTAVTPNVTVPENSFSAFSPRLALVHKLTPTFSLKSSVGEAFRAPTMFDLYAADTVSGTKLIKADRDLKPERAKSWDIGFEMTPNRGSQVRFAYFYSKISDMIYSKETPYTGPYDSVITKSVTTLSEKTNAAEGVTKGIELSVTWPLASWLSASGSYTYTDARITSDETGTGLQGKRLVFVPRNMAALRFDAAYQDWSASWTSRYTGLQYGNAKNDDIEKDVYNGTSKYWLSDLKITYRFDKQFNGSVIVGNVFDKKYYENYVMPGRNVAVQLTAAF